MISVDDRTGSKELFPLLPDPKRMERLEYGDFAWLGRGPNGPEMVGVERKKISDLVASMESGRLSGHQLLGLTTAYDRVYLLVEGEWRPRQPDGILEIYTHKRWHPYDYGSRRYMARDIYNFINSLVAACGLMYWKTDTPWQTAHWIADTYTWWQKEWERHRSFQKAHVPPPQYAQLRPPIPIVRVAMAFTGVGYDKARALSKVFHTPLELLLADDKDLMKAEGIGPKLASVISREGKEKI